MAGYRDEIYDAIDEQFRTMDGVRRFDDNPLSDPTPYEQDSPGVIQPVGWVQNADGTDGTAKVTIDSSGIEVLDGKITVKKSGGATTISGGVVQSGGVAGDVITSTEIANNAVTTPKLIANAVTATKIATDAVTASKIQADAVTASKIASGAIHVSQMLDPSENIAPNGGFEDTLSRTADTTGAWGWAISGGTATDITHGSSNAHSGDRKMRVRHNSDTSTSKDIITTDFMPVAEGSRFAVKVWYRGSATNSTPLAGQVRIISYDKNFSQITSFNLETLSIAASSTYVKSTNFYVPPSGASYIKMLLRLNGGTGATNDEVNWDDVEIYRADTNISHAAGDVVINSSGITVTNGKITVTNAGATVIIDGSSNMFKILTTGTLTKSSVAGDRGVSSFTTLTGLGALSSTPSHISFVGTDNASTGIRWGFETNEMLVAGDSWVANSSGGSPTNKVINLMRWTCAIHVGLDGSSQAIVRMVISNQDVSHTNYGRYYILKESAI